MPIPLIPFNTPALWQEANASLTAAIHRHDKRMAPARDLALKVKTRLKTLFPLMDDLCRITCPMCHDVCCRHACVWIDFKDLLFLRLARIASPQEQLLNHRGQHCRYGTAQGCRLSRLQRPFICTWYLCPTQTEQLRKERQALHRVQQELQALKKLRIEMEDAFIHALMAISP